jgi:hypothetical protein
MSMYRRIIWGSAVVTIALLLLLDLADAYPSWVVIGPVCAGVAGVALLADQVVCSPGRKWGCFASLMLIALSAGTVNQDAELVVDEWAVWPVRRRLPSYSASRSKRMRRAGAGRAGRGTRIRATSAHPSEPSPRQCAGAGGR